MTSLRELWDGQAEQWAAFARTPGHDVAHERLNLPAFLELLPPPGRAALDIGCGEGRVGGVLTQRGYRVVGVDTSARLVELARERHEAHVADAAALPFADASFDLVLAYMSLMNVDDLDGVVREAARVLEPRGRFCIAIVHPLFAAGEWQDREDVDSRFAIGDYFHGPVRVWESDRDGIRVTFHDRPLPLERYARALEQAGLLIERVREPVPGESLVRERPRAARLRRVPLFLHLRALRP